MNPFWDGSGEDEFDELAAEVNWLVVSHNHKDLLHHDTCPSCLMEWAIYGSDLNDIGGNEHE